MTEERFIEICEKFGFHDIIEGPYGVKVYFEKPYIRDFQVACYRSEEMIYVYPECFVTNGDCIITSESITLTVSEEKLIEALNEFKLNYKIATQNLRKMNLEKDFV